MIRVCISFSYLNRPCPKDTFPTPYIDQIIDNYTGGVIFSFMDGFSSYNKIEILPSDQHKMNFIFPWGPFPIEIFLFALKMPMLPSNAPCLMIYMTSRISWNLTSMIYLPICIIESTMLTI